MVESVSLKALLFNSMLNQRHQSCRNCFPEAPGCIVKFESGPANVRQLRVGDTRASGPSVPTACGVGAGGAQRPPAGGWFGGHPRKNFS